MIRELTCIGCPMGCSLKVKIENNVAVEVQGNTCKRGEIYGKKECINPTRIVTTTVFVQNRKDRVLSVKTERDIPKEKIFECLKSLKGVQAKAPISIGDIVVKNVANTGVDIISTKQIL